MQFNKDSLNYIESKFKNREANPEGNYIKSAVMVLLFNIDGEMCLLFNRRALTLKHHPGEVCFPGGKTEGDESALDTAFRETEEELGIKKENINILGRPDFIVMPNNVIVTPFLGYVENIKIKDIVFNKDEIESIFTVPISFFEKTEPKVSYLNYNSTADDNFPYELIPNGKNYKFANPNLIELFYEYNNFVIWGLTARIARNVFKIINNDLK